MVTRMALVFRLTLVVLLALLAGCQSLYFYPQKPWYQNPANIGLDYQDVVLIHPDGQRVHSWWLPTAKPARGTVLFLHGNAQNISTHIVNVGWLVAHDVNVLALDYRGYGLRDGKAGIDNAVEDIQLAIHWLKQNPKTADKPLAAFGQSIGGSLLLAALSEPETLARADCALVEGAFADYADIMSDIMRQSWLLRWMRWMFTPFAPRGLQPVDVLADVQLPLFFLHSTEDNIIPLQHGQRLFEKAAEPKRWMSLHGPHIGSARDSQYQAEVVSFLETACGFSRPPLTAPPENNGAVPAEPPVSTTPTLPGNNRSVTF